MWIEIKKENSFSTAKRIKEIIEEGGVPARLLPPRGEEKGAYSVLVPKDKEHVVQDIMRTL